MPREWRFVRKNTSLLLIALLAFTFPIRDVRAGRLCDSAVKKRAPRTQIDNPSLEKNLFKTDRGFRLYGRHLAFTQTTPFSTTVLNLPEGSTWIDMGSGTDKALVEGLIANPKIEHGVGISYKRPDAKLLENHDAVASRFESIEGDYVENLYKDGKLDKFKGKVDLISDLIGPMSYSIELPELLQVYLDLLKKDGELFFNIVIEKNYELIGGEYVTTDSPIFMNPVMHEGKSLPVGFFRWLNTVKGIQLAPEVTFFRAGGPRVYEILAGFKIRKTAETTVVPKTLINISYDSGGPPTRLYSLISTTTPKTSR